jgi:hypothetical protein
MKEGVVENKKGERESLASHVMMIKKTILDVNEF